MSAPRGTTNDWTGHGNWRYFAQVSNNPRDKKAAQARAAELNYQAKQEGSFYVHAIRKNKNGSYEIWRRIVNTGDTKQPLKLIDYEASRARGR